MNGRDLNEVAIRLSLILITFKSVVNANVIAILMNTLQKTHPLSY